MSHTHLVVSLRCASRRFAARTAATAVRTRSYASHSPSSPTPPASSGTPDPEPTAQTTAPSASDPASARRKRTMAELDAEMMARMEERSGEGGAAGLELENGEPVSMKRGGELSPLFWL